jgi:hypothetical protein
MNLECPGKAKRRRRFGSHFTTKTQRHQALEVFVLSLRDFVSLWLSGLPSASVPIFSWSGIAKSGIRKSRLPSSPQN